MGEEFPHHALPSGDVPWEAVLAWECQRCGEWIREFGRDPTTGPCRPGEQSEPEAPRF